MPVTVIAQEKGRNTRENVLRNFAMPSPEGYRKALRLMKQAEKFHRPVICFVDTPGAFCGMEAEERGQGEAIARNLFEMSGLKTPVLSIVIGEGGSGGALAMAVADEVWMLENAVYSVIAPEGCASILWKDPAKVEEAAKPFHLRIEGPMDVEDREKQMIALKTITKLLDDRHINVEIVADEWCNTLEDIKYFADNRAGHMVQIKTPDLGGINNIVEAVLYCKAKGIGAYQGGTCNETDRSAQVCVHCAMATRPVQILAKPGMGVDEGYMIVYNEMQRIIAMHKAKQAAK